jgi:hypothetical protein
VNKIMSLATIERIMEIYRFEAEQGIESADNAFIRRVLWIRGILRTLNEKRQIFMQLFQLLLVCLSIRLYTSATSRTITYFVSRNENEKGQQNCCELT